MSDQMDIDEAAREAIQLFEREIGASVVEHAVQQVGTEIFLKFKVGRDTPLYRYSLQQTQSRLPDASPFKGRLGIDPSLRKRFPASLEAICLSTLLTRSTRAIAEGHQEYGFVVPYVPFQNREDHLLAQPANHLVMGRRGVGKSTLIRRAIELIEGTASVVAVLDMQPYAAMPSLDIEYEVLIDLTTKLIAGLEASAASATLTTQLNELATAKTRLESRSLVPAAAIPSIKRTLKEVTSTTRGHVFVFLDDYHLLPVEVQPELLHLLNGALKGASGWLKVAGVRTQTVPYSPTSRKGLQVPGDAQEISLDLTLENPQAAQHHLRAILNGFLAAIGYSVSDRVLPEAAFRRLVWANAGVPRDFLQMFARALEHARRSEHSSVTVSDVNIAIGESGQRKYGELEEDAGEELPKLKLMLKGLESYCLDEHKVNAFLLKSEDSEERRLIRKLSDLRLAHLIHQSITPDRAGERYEAFIVDYSLFTGFRRRPNIREMVPSSGQFKAAELRKLPKLDSGFLAEFERRQRPSAIEA